MPDLNLENIEKLLDKKVIPLKGTIGSLEGTIGSMSKTLNAVAAQTANLVVDVSEMKTEVKEVHTTVNNHTGTLDKVLTTTNKLFAERLVATDRLKRLENWAEQVGQKLGIKLEV